MELSIIETNLFMFTSTFYMNFNDSSNASETRTRLFKSRLHAVIKSLKDLYCIARHPSVFQDWKHILLLTTGNAGANK